MYNLTRYSGLCILFTLINPSDGLYCLSCPKSVSPRHCHEVKKCSGEEVCFTESHYSLNGNVVFETGCISKDSELCYSKRDNGSDSQNLQRAIDPHYPHHLCLDCCSSDLCNQKGCGQKGFPLNRSVCFNCQDVANPSLCDTITVCYSDQVCYVQQTYEYNDIIFTSGCINKQSCPPHIDIFGKRNAEYCSKCCPSDLCNANCDAEPSLSTTPSTTVKTTTQSGSTAAPQPKGSLGKEFLVLFMQNHPSANGSLVVKITTTNRSSLKITSSRKLNQTMKFKIERNTLTLNFNSYASIPFPFDLACHELVTEYKAVIIRTTDVSSVTLFDSNDTLTNDGTLVIPTHKLSTEYLVSSTEGLYVSSFHASQFTVGILHNNTNLNITFNIKKNESITIDGAAYWSGGVYKKTFGELDTFQVSHERDLTGTYITSNKPVAVFSGNKCQDFLGTNCSHMVSQLPPIDQLDDNYIIPSFFNNSETLIQVLSPFHNNVNVSTGIDKSRLRLNKKEHNNIRVNTTEITIVNSERPIMVTGYAMGSSSNGPYMTVIPGINQYLDYYKIVVPDQYRDNYLCVIIPTGSYNNLHINQIPVGHFDAVYQRSVISSGKSFYVRTISVKEGVYTLRTTDQEPFGLIVYGHRNNDGYGFAGNFVSP